jgi:hypothetical protein
LHPEANKLGNFDGKDPLDLINRKSIMHILTNYISKTK